MNAIVFSSWYSTVHASIPQHERLNIQHERLNIQLEQLNFKPVRQNISHKNKTYQDNSLRHQNKVAHPKLNKAVCSNLKQTVRPEVSKGGNLNYLVVEIVEEVNVLRDILL